MERDNVRYKVSRKSKTGRINKKMIYLAATVTAIGVVGVSSHFISKDNKYSFNDKYSNGVKLQSYPAFIIISNKTILDIVQSSNNKITIFDIERILDEYEVREK